MTVTRSLLTQLKRLSEHPVTAALNINRIDTHTALCRVVWNSITEPGDEIAGYLCAALNPVNALTQLCTAPNETQFQTRLAETIGQSALAADDITPRLLTSAYLRWQPRLSTLRLGNLLDRAHRHRMRLLTPEHPEWPQQLSDLGHARPHVLWYFGDPALLCRPGLAVVGARAVTAYGQDVTAELTHTAIDLQLTVISGAAYGVDAVAHRTALAREHPTIAVLAGGLDQPYPRAHHDLLENISQQGVVLAEAPPGTHPTRWRFLQRNRLIAALAVATLVTEAGYRSGAINTAGHAAQLGRPVGAVPGRIDAANSAGCHRLIRDYAATLIGNGSDLRTLCDSHLDAVPDLLASLDHVESDGTESSPAESGATEAGETDPAETDPAETDPAETDPVETNSPETDSPETDSADTGGDRLELSGAASSPRPPSRHVRVLDALPKTGSRTAKAIAAAAGLAIAETQGVLSELEVLGEVRRNHTPNDTRWSLP